MHNLPKDSTKRKDFLLLLFRMGMGGVKKGGSYDPTQNGAFNTCCCGRCPKLDDQVSLGIKLQ